MQKFILHWGEMSARWGINRTVAQIHALLYLSSEPLNAEQIAGSLSVARSNVSTSLRELQGWGLVNVVHVLGDRRDHFQATNDVWEMFRIILQERKRREVDPAVAMLRKCVQESRKSGGVEGLAEKRLMELLAFFETMTAWYDQIHRMPRSTVTKFVKMGDKVRKLLNAAS